MIVDVSIIVPVYKVEQYLSDCIESILSQTYHNFEMILIDDGSPDYSGIICEKYKKKDGRIQVIHKKKDGVMAAWIDGINMAVGEYICFVDSDDWISNNMVEVMYEKARKYNIDMVVGNFSNVIKGKFIKAKPYFKDGYYEKDNIYCDIYPNLINTGIFQERGIPVSRWGKLIKKSIILNNIKYTNTDIIYGEDFNIIFPVILDCETIYILKAEDCLYYYRKNSTSIQNTYISNMYCKVEKLYEILFNVNQDKNKYDFSEQLTADYVTSIVQCYKNELRSGKKLKDILAFEYELANNKKILKAVTNTDVSSYSTLNKLIIKTIKPQRKFKSFLIGVLLYYLKYYKDKFYKWGILLYGLHD